MTLVRAEFDAEYVRRLVAADPATEAHFAAYFGELLTINRVPLKPGLTRTEAPFRVRMPMQGSLRLELQVQVGGETVSSTERMRCVLPALDATPNPNSFFGGHGSVGTAGEWHVAVQPS